MTDTADTQPEKLPLTSMDIAEEKRELLKQCLAAAFPEAAAEDKIDFDQLKRVLGEWVEPDRERFGLNWPGKAACMKVIQAPSVGTLKPCPEESVDWDTTENLFIEGDNLEVLKLLQKAYFGKVKMIYIDPPYNTGKEFIYPDKYAETLDTYLEYTGQKDSEGRKFSTNTDTSGRFHSRWLNMMYSRMYLAKNLLRDDGVVFVSINDIEAANLRRMLDEIFGEENFVSQIVWQRSKRGDAKQIANIHEYVLCYARNSEASLRDGFWRKPKEGVSEVLAHYQELRSKYRNDHAEVRREMMDWYRGLPNGDPRKSHKHYNWSDDRGLYFAADFAGPDDGRKNRPRHDIFHPVTGRSCKKPSTGWRWDEEKTKWALNQEPPRIHFGEDENTIPTRKTYLHEIDSEPFSSVFYADGRSATLEVESIVGKGIYQFPKNKEVIAELINLICRDGDLVLDFFAGSGTTGHSCYLLAEEAGKNVKFVLVQLPEVCEPDSPAFAAGYKNIADVAKARLKGAASTASDGGSDKDRGFRVFSLAPSCFRLWNGETSSLDDKDLIERIASHGDHLEPEATAEDILFELLLKDGFPLTVPLERLEVAAKEVFSIGAGALLICLDKELTQELMDALAEMEPARVICLDAGFKGNDQLKANAVQTFKARARTKETAIEFRTV